MNKYEIDTKKIGERINQERKNANLTQKNIAEITGVSRWTVSDWLYGKEIPSIKKMAILCNKFDCDIDYLLCMQSCKRKNISSIHDVTGLSEKAINIISKEYKESEPFPSGKLVSILNTLIESDNGETFSKILSNIGLAIVENMSDAKTPSQYWNSDRFLKAYNYEASSFFSKLINEAEKEYLSKMPQEKRETIYSMYHNYDK